MSTRELLRKSMTDAMRSGDTLSRDVLRMVEGVIRNKEIELRSQKKEITEDDLVHILSSQIKQRRESSRQYLEGGRSDLSERENQEADILEQFLPKKVSSEELESIVRTTIEMLGARSVSDMGKVIGASLLEAKKVGFVEGNDIREMAVKLLSAGASKI